MPEESSAALKSDPPFNKAFQLLTDGKKGEYCEFIDNAKRMTTKQSRLEKIKPLILLGKELYDKYKNC